MNKKIELSLLSLNLHCLEEENISEKQQIIVENIISNNIDIIFLQEVAQFFDKPIIEKKIKKSNYGHTLQQLLLNSGQSYYYYYEPIKKGFNKYDEGLAFLSKYPLTNIDSKYISKTKDYNNFRSRKYLKGTITLNEKEIDLITTHLGWDSRVESYLKQLENLVKNAPRKQTLIGGDFNIFCGSNYYNKSLELGLIDLYGLNESRKYDYSFENDLDVHKGSARIDYIFSKELYTVLDQKILFKHQKVSDHYGLFLKILI